MGGDVPAAGDGFRLWRADQPPVGRRRTAVLLCLRRGDGPLAQLGFPRVHGHLDRHHLPDHGNRLCEPQPLWLCHQT
ncbi:UNVERIFIED_CONTAM: hypothetical protein NCL1_00491 [Trichonephila clavipes]